MLRRLVPTPGQVVERLARLSPPRHRELVRGMAAELHAIVEPAERTRFALGAVAAIARLMLTGYSRTLVHASGRFVGVLNPFTDPPGGPAMSDPATRHLLRRHAVAFAVSCGALTSLLLAQTTLRRVPDLVERGVPAGTIAEILILALPHTLALTVPMAVFIAVTWVFSRLGAEGVLASARRERNGLRRLVLPVLGAAAVVSTLTLASNTQALPRANARLAEVFSGSTRLSDRTMTVGELRDAARTARTSSAANGAARAAGYEVEIQKKFALAAACLFLALAGVATAIRFPRGGARLVIGASVVVFTGYYFAVVGGEALADRQVVSPLVAMWAANAFLLGIVALLVGRPGGRGPTHRREPLAIGG